MAESSDEMSGGEDGGEESVESVPVVKRAVRVVVVVVEVGVVRVDEELVRTRRVLREARESVRLS